MCPDWFVCELAHFTSFIEVEHAIIASVRKNASIKYCIASFSLLKQMIFLEFKRSNKLLSRNNYKTQVKNDITI